jgi:hypothetical protein
MSGPTPADPSDPSDLAHPPRVPGLPEIGQRASIRLFEPEGGFRDLLGILESPTTIRKKDGSLITFDPGRIFLWKVVPPK